MSQEAMILLSIEMSNKQWKLGFGDGSHLRERSLEARDQKGLLKEVALAKKKFKLPEDSAVKSCYEAGRDGFWLHHFLNQQGIDNQVIDPASIEVNRRKRRTKTDRIDCRKMLELLKRRELYGENKAYSVVRVPDERTEDGMRVFREREKSHVCRIKALLNLKSIQLEKLLKCDFRKLSDWNGKALGKHLLQELEREQERLLLVRKHLKEIEKYQGEQIREPSSDSGEISQRLGKLRGVGKQSAWVLSREMFAWRKFRNRKEVGACAGLVGTPYDSGNSRREQGISKAGNRRVRYVMIELAWSWLRFQPGSELSRWFQKRFAKGTQRQRRVGIVAVARKLLIALWKYVEYGEVPKGAEFGGEIK